jgi:acetolactate synthase-1/2/3 large subunit
MLDLGRPDLDFVALARSMGVPGRRVDTMDDFNRAVGNGLASKGPNLVEVMLV